MTKFKNDGKIHILVTHYYITKEVDWEKFIWKGAENVWNIVSHEKKLNIEMKIEMKFGNLR